MKLPFAISCLLCYPMTAYSEAWLCLGEKAVGIEIDLSKNEIGKAEAYDASDQKYLVSDKGMWAFGSDNILLPSCTYRDDGKLSRCSDPSNTTHNLLLWTGTNIFEYNFARGVDMKEEEVSRAEIVTIVGKCSKL